MRAAGFGKKALFPETVILKNLPLDTSFHPVIDILCCLAFVS
jgi:hypothetical protein